MRAFPYPIAAPPHPRARVVATLAVRAAISWDGSNAPPEPFAQDLRSPVAGFTRSGWLVMADADQCRLYRAEAFRSHLEATLSGSGAQPLAILPCPQPDQR